MRLLPISLHPIIPPALNCVGLFRCPFGDMSDGPHVGKVRSRDPPWYPMTWASILTLGIFKLLQTYMVLFPQQIKSVPRITVTQTLMWSLVQQR